MRRRNRRQLKKVVSTCEHSYSRKQQGIYPLFDQRMSNPYGHNRFLTRQNNHALQIFAKENLGLDSVNSAYIGYLALKTLQIERLCIGRLATTVQDGVIRQLVTDCINSDQIGILEIGALYGVSLALLYNHVVAKHDQAKVVSLDPLDGYYGQALDPLLNLKVNEYTFRRNMEIAHVPEEGYELIKRYSNTPEALDEIKNLKIEINILIIDGDHTYEGVKRDFELYFPLVQAGGYIVFDDYNAKEWPGVQSFVDNNLKEYSDFEYLGYLSRTAVGRKRV